MPAFLATRRRAGAKSGEKRRFRGRYCIAWSRSAIRSWTSSMPTDSRISPSSMPIAARWAAGIEACVIRPGCSIRLSTPPRLSANEKIWQRSSSRRAREPRRHRPRPTPSRRRLASAASPARAADATAGPDNRPSRTPDAALEPVGDLQGAFAMPLHPQGERFQTAQRQKAIERPADRADRVLQKSKLIGQILSIADDRHAADHVAMAVEIFGHRMHDDVESQRQRALHDRGSQTCCRPR